MYVCWGAVWCVCMIHASVGHFAIGGWRRGAPAAQRAVHRDTVRYCQWYTLGWVYECGGIFADSWQLGAARRPSLPFPVFVRVLSPESPSLTLVNDENRDVRVEGKHDEMTD